MNMTHNPKNKPDSPFSVTQTEDSSGFLLWQTTVVWQRRIVAALRPHELTHTQFVLLASLMWLSQRETRITQTRLAQHAQLDLMMTSQVLRSLEKRGLLNRTEHPTDTRAKVLNLTLEGEQKARAAIPDVERTDHDFFNTLGSQTRVFNQQLVQLIESASPQS